MTPAVHGKYRLQLLNFQSKILHCFKKGLVIGFPGMLKGAQRNLHYSIANKGFETINYGWNMQFSRKLAPISINEA